MTISRDQLHVGRMSLQLNATELARLAGVAPNSVHGIERGADFKASTMLALEEVMEAKGLIFKNDSVCERMVWQGPGGRPSSKKVREATLGILNAGRRSRAQCDLVDIGDV